MLEMVLPLTVPVSELVAVADELLWELLGFAFAVAPLLAAAAPMALALAPPLELLLFAALLLSLVELFRLSLVDRLLLS